MIGRQSPLLTVSFRARQDTFPDRGSRRIEAGQNAHPHPAAAVSCLPPDQLLSPTPEQPRRPFLGKRAAALSRRRFKILHIFKERTRPPLYAGAAAPARHAGIRLIPPQPQNIADRSSAAPVRCGQHAPDGSRTKGSAPRRPCGAARPAASGAPPEGSPSGTPIYRPG